MTSNRHGPQRVLAINGSYRDGGVSDQVIALALARLREAGAQTEEIRLRDYPIEFCTNCRECMQRPGGDPGHCVLDDGMAALVQRIEAADAYILSAPTNLGSLSAVFKRFMERLAVYGYWPWGAAAPRMRKTVPGKRAMLVSSSAAPGFLARWFYGSARQLRTTARAIGAQPVGLLFCGLVSAEPQPRLSKRVVERAQSLALKLLES